MCPRAKTSWIKAFASTSAMRRSLRPSISPVSLPKCSRKADDRLAQLLAEIEARGVLAPEGDQVAAKTHVVADKDFEA